MRVLGAGPSTGAAAIDTHLAIGALGIEGAESTADALATHTDRGERALVIALALVLVFAALPATAALLLAVLVFAPLAALVPSRGVLVADTQSDCCQHRGQAATDHTPDDGTACIPSRDGHGDLVEAALFHASFSLVLTCLQADPDLRQVLAGTRSNAIVVPMFHHLYGYDRAGQYIRNDISPQLTH
jgi:hypothetical protein